MGYTISFRGVNVTLDHDPRTGVCNWCRYVLGTVHPKTGRKYSVMHMHHDKYDPVDALLHTIEVCPPCHRKAHKQERNGDDGSDVDGIANKDFRDSFYFPEHLFRLGNLIVKELPRPPNLNDDEDNTVYVHEVIEAAYNFYLDFYVRLNNVLEDTEKAKTEEPDYNLVLP